MKPHFPLTLQTPHGTTFFERLGVLCAYSKFTHEVPDVSIWEVDVYPTVRMHTLIWDKYLQNIAKENNLEYSKVDETTIDCWHNKPIGWVKAKDFINEAFTVEYNSKDELVWARYWCQQLRFMCQHEWREHAAVVIKECNSLAIDPTAISRVIANPWLATPLDMELTEFYLRTRSSEQHSKLILKDKGVAIVDGKEIEISAEAHTLLSLMLECGKKPVTLADFARAKIENAGKMIERMCKKDPWKHLIIRPGGKNKGGYRLSL